MNVSVYIQKIVSLTKYKHQLLKKINTVPVEVTEEGHEQGDPALFPPFPLIAFGGLTAFGVSLYFIPQKNPIKKVKVNISPPIANNFHFD